MYAVNNFWNTTDISIIDSMIYDKNDDLSSGNYIEFEPILTEPHPDTPTLDFNQPPTADAGIDQIIFDTITLNGSKSTDPDGGTLTYSWQLNHRTNLTNNRTAIGIAPTISNLQSGFYDVILTTKDDGNLTDTDTIMFSATGTPSGYTLEQLNQAVADEREKWDIAGDGKVGIEEAINALKIITGVQPE